MAAAGPWRRAPGCLSLRSASGGPVPASRPRPGPASQLGRPAEEAAPEPGCGLLPGSPRPLAPSGRCFAEPFPSFAAAAQAPGHPSFLPSFL